MKKEEIGTICPACGRANGCQMTGDKKCWCFDVSVDKSKLDQAAREESKDQCLCRDCLRKLSVP